DDQSASARCRNGQARQRDSHERNRRRAAHNRSPGSQRQPLRDAHRSRAVIWRRPIVALWCGLLLLALWIVFARTTISADLVAFLPRSATPAQQLMVDQLRDGIASRLVLFGIEGESTEAVAQASRAFAAALQETGHFSYVNNGEQRLGAADQRFLFEHRYLLSPDVTSERFTVAG